MAGIDNERSLSIPKLNTTNYHDWAIDAKMVMMERGLVEFIESEPGMPTIDVTEAMIQAAETDVERRQLSTDKRQQEADRRMFKLRKDKAHAVLFLSITQELKSLVKNCESAFQLWEKLRATYEPISLARAAQLRRKFLNLSLKDGEDMSLFICRVDDAVTECRNAGVLIQEYEHAFQYIDLLPRAYDVVTHNLHHLTFDTLTTRTTAETLIAEFHRLNHLKSNGNGKTGDTGALFTSTEAQRATVKCYNCGKLGHYAPDCRSGKPKNNQTNNSSVPPKDTSKSKKKRTSKQKKKSAANQVSSQPMGSSEVDPGKGTKAVLISEVENSGSSANSVKSKWYVDSAATDHICFEKSYFHNFRPSQHSLALGEGHSQCPGEGDILLYHECQGRIQEILLTNVLYAPHFSKNLLSAARMDERGYKSLVNQGKCYVFKEHMNNSIVIAEKEGRLYGAVATVKIDPDFQNAKDNGCIILTNQAECVGKSTAEIWHRRFCHQNLRGIKMVKDRKFVFGLDDVELDGSCNCEVCDACKITNSSSCRTIDIQTTGPLELLHLDLWGPAQVNSLGGSKYLLTVLDDFSRMSFAIPMPAKSRTLTEVKQLIQQLEKQLNSKVRKIRTDNGSEFTSKDFAEFTASLGVVHQFTNAYTPQMNGVAERFNRTLIEGTRALLADSGLPKTLWAEMANAFTYVKNRSSHSKLGGQTPISKFSGKTPSVKHLRIIGSRCTVLKTPLKRGGKLDPKGWSGILVGYANHTKGYRVWNPEDRQVTETRHVKIVEMASKWPTSSKTESRVDPGRLTAQLQGQGESRVDPGRHTLCSTPDAESRVDPGRLQFPQRLDTESRVDPGQFQPQPTSKIPSRTREAQELFFWTEDDVDVQTNDDQAAATSKANAREEPAQLSVRQTESRVDPGRCLPEIPAITWHREFSRPHGRDKTVNIRYTNDAGETLYHEKAVKDYHLARGLVFDPNNFDFSGFQINTYDDEISFPGLQRQVADSGVEAGVIDPNPQAFLTMSDPATYKQAVESEHGQHWIRAMQEEVTTLKQREVFTEVEKPQGAKVLGTKWVFKTKTDSNGETQRHRARFVVQGFRQTQGIDYDEVFSPVVNFVVIRLFILLLVVRRQWVDAHLDIKCAYLYGELQQTTFVAPPEGFQNSTSPNTVWLLKRALYGLHQSGRQWYARLVEELLKIGFIRIPGFSCAFQLNNIAVLLFYVDDLVLFAINNSFLQSVIRKVSQVFDITNLGRIQKLLGVVFDRRQGKIQLNQTGYISNLAKEFEIEPNKLVKVPLNVGTILQKPAEAEEHSSNFPYRSLVGSLLFLATRTRPDLLFPVILLSQFNTCFTRVHEKCLLQVLQYACNTQTHSLNLSDCSSDCMFAFTDASWANDRDERKSFGGFLIFLGGVPLSWGCKKQSVVALSSMEAEFMAIVNCLRELHWLAGIFSNFSPVANHQKLPVVFSDSLAAIHFSRNDLETSRTKHIDIKYFFVKDWLARGYFELKSVSGKLNLADIFTKPQNAQSLDRFRQAVFA